MLCNFEYFSSKLFFFTRNPESIMITRGSAQIDPQWKSSFSVPNWLRNAISDEPVMWYSTLVPYSFECQVIFSFPSRVRQVWEWDYCMCITNHSLPQGDTTRTAVMSSASPLWCGRWSPGRGPSSALARDATPAAWPSCTPWLMVGSLLPFLPSLHPSCLHLFALRLYAFIKNGRLE